MATKMIPACDVCKGLIMFPKGGVILMGRMFQAELDPTGSPVGLVLGAPALSSSLTSDPIPEASYCRRCFHKALPWFRRRGGKKKGKEAPSGLGREEGKE